MLVWNAFKEANPDYSEHPHYSMAMAMAARAGDYLESHGEHCSL